MLFPKVIIVVQNIVMLFEGTPIIWLSIRVMEKLK